MKATILFAVLVLAFGLASAAVSAPIAYEDFGVYVTYEDSIGGLEGRIVPNFKDGNPVGGQTPPDTATGGIYNWVAPVNPWGAHRVYAGDLSYPGHFMGGGQRFREESGGLDVTATLDVQSVTGSAGGVFSSLENPAGVIGQDGSTLYVSFLYQLLGTGTSVTQNFLEFREGATNRFRFGQVWQDDQITAQGFDLTPLDTNPHLAVLKIDYAPGDDSVSLFFDPVAGQPESSQTVTNTYTRPMEMDQIYFKGQGNSFDFDELRFGTTWEDVVPVAGDGPTVTISSISSTGVFPVASDDLIEGLLPTIVGGIEDQEGLNTDTSGAALTNGTFGPAGLTNSPGPNPELTIIDNNVELTYDLSEPADITDINVYSGWRDGGRVDQDYEILYTTSSDPVFQPLTTVSEDHTAGDPPSLGVFIAVDGLTDVTAIRFAFTGVQNGYVGYKEIDVIGSASAAAIPEPSSFVLAMLGLLGLGVVGRPRRRK